MKHSVEQLTVKSYALRRRFLELFTALGFGHVTSAFSWTEIAVVLYYELMNRPQSIDDLSADRMVVSKGHGAGMLFPIYEDLGYFSRKEMEDTLRIGGDSSKLRRLFYPGFDFYGGSLGIGLGVAAGLAKAEQLSGTSRNIWCVVGDAECYEGAIWEAAHFAGHHHLEQLIVIVDRNKLGCSDFTERTLQLEPFADKWRACNFDVYETDGHDIEALYQSLHTAMSAKGRPKCVIANTRKGQGLEYLIDKPLMHGYMPVQESDIQRAFQELR